jgi:hypothetical protein
MQITSIEYLNAKIANWYTNAKRDYNVNGEGFAKWNAQTEEVEIHYTEDGVRCFWSTPIFDGYTKEVIFNIWMEQANVESDAI